MSFEKEIVTSPLLEIEVIEASGGTGGGRGTYGIPDLSASFLLRRSSSAKAALQSKTFVGSVEFSELLAFSSVSSSLTVEVYSTYNSVDYVDYPSTLYSSLSSRALASSEKAGFTINVIA